MKQKIKNEALKVFTCLLIGAMLSPGLRSQDLGTAPGYLQYITTEFTNMQKDSWDYTRAVAKNKSARKVESRRKELVATINTAIGRVKKLKGFENDVALRDTCVSFLKINKAVIEQDYSKIM